VKVRKIEPLSPQAAEPLPLEPAVERHSHDRASRCGLLPSCYAIGPTPLLARLATTLEIVAASGERLGVGFSSTPASQPQIQLLRTEASSSSLPGREAPGKIASGALRRP